MWFTWKMEELQQRFPAEFEKYIASLRGNDLACWCPLSNQHCHAGVLPQLSNAQAAPLPPQREQ
jgi:hypothetical protein